MCVIQSKLYGYDNCVDEMHLKLEYDYAAICPMYVNE